MTSDTLASLRARHAAFTADDLSLNLTRGKPAAAQLDLSDAMASVNGAQFADDNGTDLRNYGGSVAGIDELGSWLLDVPIDNVLSGGNASLELMWHTMALHALFGVDGPASAWRELDDPVVICPVPGYDRHFTLTDRMGLAMVTVPMLDDGPDMEAVEQLVASDADVVAMWNVPKHQNPTGTTYGGDVVERIAALGTTAGQHFRVLWDNAYAVHDLTDDTAALASIWEAAQRHGTLDNLLVFASTSKITWAGAGVGFVGASASNLAALRHHLSSVTIGPDKPNHARHVNLLGSRAELQDHMRGHAALLAPKFELVLEMLVDELGDGDWGRWTTPTGGYFISFWSQPGLATRIVELAADAGVALTPAGAAYPHGDDPDDSHIRLAPSLPILDELDTAMRVFTNSVKLATLEAQHQPPSANDTQ